MKKKQSTEHCCPHLTKALEEGYLQVPLLQWDGETGTQKTPQVYVEAMVSDPSKKRKKTINVFLNYCLFCGAKMP